MSKRVNGEGSIRKRSNGTWEARYTIKDADGNLKRKSIYGKTKKEVSEKLGSVEQEIREGTYIPTNDKTVKEWGKEWLDNYLLKARESTKYQYEQYLRLYVYPVIGEMPIQQVKATNIKDVIAKNCKKDLSPKTIRNIYGILHHMFLTASDMEIITKNPVIKKIKDDLPDRKKVEMIILDGEEVNSFLKEIENKPYEELFFVDLFTGMREGEILGLTWDCVDFEKKTILIKQQLKRDSHIGEKNSQYVIAETKTGRERTIHPASSVFTMLKENKRKQTENKLKNGSNYLNEKNYVFTDELGRWINGRTLLKAFKKRAAAIGKEDMRFHDLRHTYVSIRLENGDDLKSISEDLGHSNIQTTANEYGHLTKKMREDSADRMENYIRKKSSTAG